MKTCSSCGAQLPDFAMFCTSCGASLDETEGTTVLNEEYEIDTGTTVLISEEEICGGPTVLASEEDFDFGTTVLSEDELFNPNNEGTTLLIEEEETSFNENITTIDIADNTKSGKPKKKGKIIAAVIAVILIVAIGVIFGVPGLRFSVLSSLGFYDDSYDYDTSYEDNQNVNISYITTNYTYDEVSDSFVNGIYSNNADCIDQYVIPYADEINIVLKSDSYMDRFYYVDPTIDFVAGRELLDWKTNYNYLLDNFDFSFDLKRNYYDRDDLVVEELAENDLAILDEVINEVFSSHGLERVSIENYIYLYYDFYDENDELVDGCEVGIVETSEGCFILSFE